MAQTKRKRRRLRYSWALHFTVASPEAQFMSREGRLGLMYAQALAQNARLRSQLALKDRLWMPEKMTIEQIAAEEELSPIQIHSMIKSARTELFGKDLSQSAIYYRLKQRHQRRNRHCAHPGCTIAILPPAPISRLYCTKHAKPKYRTRRHREHHRNQSHQQPANPPGNNSEAHSETTAATPKN